MTATVPAIVPTIVEEPMDFTLIATNPEAVQTAQRQLILWAARKMQAVKQEIVETEAELKQAIERKWNASGWRRELSKQRNRVEFYRKIKMALEAGYYIVPPFPIDIFAIRTKRTSPHRYDSTHSNNHDQPAQILPAGEGRYVDPAPFTSSYSENEKQRDGSIKAVTHYYASDYDKVDFPFKLAKAEVKVATDPRSRPRFSTASVCCPASAGPILWCAAKSSTRRRRAPERGRAKPWRPEPRYEHGSHRKTYFTDCGCEYSPA